MIGKKNLLLMVVAGAVLAGIVVPYCLAQEHNEHEDRLRFEHRRDDRHERDDDDRLERMIDEVDRMADLCFDRRRMAMIAIGGLKDEVKREGEAVAGDLEVQLKKVKTQGLRNAIHLMLKDMYKARGKNDMVLRHLRALLSENDAAIQREEDDDEDDEEDDDDEDDEDEDDR